MKSKGKKTQTNKSVRHIAVKKTVRKKVVKKPSKEPLPKTKKKERVEIVKTSYNILSYSWKKKNKKGKRVEGKIGTKFSPYSKPKKKVVKTAKQEAIRKKKKAIGRVRKYRTPTGMIVSQEMADIATILCEAFRKVNIRCSYSYIIKKMYELVAYLIKNKKLPSGMVRKDEMIASQLRFSRSYKVRNDCLEFGQELYEQKKISHFYINNLFIKDDFGSVVYAVYNHSAPMEDFGVFILDVFKTALYYRAHGKKPIAQNQMQEDLMAYMDFYDTYFTVSFVDKVAKFEYKQKAYGWFDYFDAYYKDDITKRMFFVFMEQCDYYLNYFWAAKDDYMSGVDKGTAAFAIYSMYESLTKTYYLDFKDFELEGMAYPDFSSYLTANIISTTH